MADLLAGPMGTPASSRPPAQSPRRTHPRLVETREERKIPAGRIDDLPTFASAVKSSFEGHEGCSCEIHEGEKAGVFDAAIVHARNLEATEDCKGCELLRAGIDTGRELIYITVRLKKGRAEEALKLLRAMLVTFKLSGPDSLDPFLTNRRLHQATVLSFRLPRGFERRAKAKPSRAIFTSVNASTSARLTLVPSPQSEVEKALEERAKGLKPLGRSWTFPHPNDCRAIGRNGGERPLRLHHDRRRGRRSRADPYLPRLLTVVHAYPSTRLDRLL